MEVSKYKLLIMSLFSCLSGMIILGPCWISWIRDMPSSDPIGFYFFQDRTIYASGFSESKFKLIKKGMSKEEIENIIGKPLIITQKCMDNSQNESFKILIFNEDIELIKPEEKKNCPTKEIWSYSYEGPGSHYYHIRDVFFEGKNATLVRSFFED